jgi:hypothetical protein
MVVSWLDLGHFLYEYLANHLWDTIHEDLGQVGRGNAAQVACNQGQDALKNEVFAPIQIEKHNMISSGSVLKWETYTFPYKVCP